MLIKQDENYLIECILKNGPEILNLAEFSEHLDQYQKIIIEEKLEYPYPNTDSYGEWLIPKEYQTMDVEKFLIDICPEENHDRLTTELNLYKKHNMIPILKAMKYLVDKFREHSIVWGVGRGSSVASYALFLIGVHKIDSVKYGLPIEEFFKGEKNGQDL
jgi:DNA polymerase III alpha subunit